MALVALGGHIRIPVDPVIIGGNAYFDTSALDAAAHFVACVFRVPKAGNITKVGFLITASTVKDDVLVTLHTVDLATGLPEAGAYKGAAVGTLASADVSNAFKWVALGTQATAAVKGDVVAAKIGLTFVDGVISIGHSAYCLGDGQYNSTFQPAYALVDLGAGSWTKKTLIPIIGIEYDDGSIEQICGAYPFSALTAISTWSSEHTPVFIGNKLTLPFKCRVSGLWASIDGDGDFTLHLYDTDGYTELGSVACDKDVRAGTAIAMVQGRLATPVTLTVGGTYYLAVEPTTTDHCAIQTFTVTDDGANKAMAAVPFGESIQYIQLDAAPSSGSHAWAATATRRAMCGLLVDQLDDGVSAGGGAIGLDKMGAL
jgi:hypothetical protein